MNIRLFSQVPLRHGWKLLLLMLSFGPVCGASAQADLNILFTNGPASNRVNIVFFSEGYQTNQLPQFLNDAAAAVSNLFSKQSIAFEYYNPYVEYSNYFNAYAVSVASTNSGSNHSLISNTNKTYFRSTYGGNGIVQLITIPPNSLDSNFADGAGKVQALLTNQALYAATNLAIATNVLKQVTSSNRFLVLIVNDTTYGGSDTPPNLNTPLPIAITSLGNSSSNGPAARVLLHESGHAIGGLADEYTNNYAITPVERPNATMVTNMDQITWNAWITNYDVNAFGSAPPIPMPDNGSTANEVGLVEGAEYHATGWYRPMDNCIMNQISAAGFCPVCSEAIVKAIYQKVDSIDSYFPNTNNNHVTIGVTNGIAFGVVSLQPATHSLNLQWFTNGVAVPGVTNSTFTLFPGNFTNGPCSVQAQVVDTTVIPQNNSYYTTLVLSDPNHYLSNSVSWNVTIGLTTLQLVSPRWLGGGQFTFTVSGTAPNGFVIQASTNLVNWVPLSTNTLTGGLFNYTNNAGFSQRYYWTVTP
jgi:hypothetical protein